MSTAGSNGEGRDTPPPLPQRVRRWTVTRPGLITALGKVMPIAEPEYLEDLAGAILAGLPTAPSLPGWDRVSLDRLDSAVMAHARPQDGQGAPNPAGSVSGDSETGTEALRAALDLPAEGSP